MDFKTIFMTVMFVCVLFLVWLFRFILLREAKSIEKKKSD